MIGIKHSKCTIKPWKSVVASRIKQAWHPHSSIWRAIEGDKGNLDIQKSYLLEALPYTRAVGNKRAESYALRLMGDVEANSGNRESAISYYHEALTLSESVNLIMTQCGTLMGLGRLYAKEGDTAQALSYYYDALKRSMEIDFMFDTFEAINRITAILIDSEDKTTLVRWLCGTYQASAKYNNRNELEERLQSLESSMDSESYHTACEDGQKLDFKTLINEILEHGKNKNEQ